MLIVFSSSELGGAERSLTRMALGAQGSVAFDLATLDGPGAWSDWCIAMGTAPVVLGDRRADAAHGRIGSRALLRLVRLVRAKGYDALYVVGFRASLMLRVVKPWLRGTRLVQGVRWNPNSGEGLDRAFRFAERLLKSLIDVYVVNCRAAAMTLSKGSGISAGKVKVIYNGFDGLPETSDAEGRPLTVVTVANLSPRKGHIQFLDVIERVRANTPVHFVFVGRDDLHRRVEQEIHRRGLSEAVSLVGFVEDVGPYLSRARLMVLPSLWGEGCPTSILEGFAHSLPVIAYAIDGIPELVTDQEDGILVKLGDQGALAAAIERILGDEALARRMGEAGRAKVDSHFTLARCIELHVEVFTDLIGGHSELPG